MSEKFENVQRKCKFFFVGVQKFTGNENDMSFHILKKLPQRSSFHLDKDYTNIQNKG